MRLLSYAGLIFGLVLGLLSVILFVQRQKPSTAEWIFFSATPASQSDLYRYNPHTHHLEQLSFALRPEILVTADSSGQFLYLLVANEFLGVDAYRVNLNGWHWRNFEASPHELTEQYPYQQSPDGKWLAVSYLVADGNAEIFRRDTQSDKMYPLTETPQTTEIEPAWSPDGQWIAFVSNQAVGWGLYRMRSDGSQREELVKLNGTVERPIWLPPLDEKWHSIYLFLGSSLSVLGGLSVVIMLWLKNTPTKSFGQAFTKVWKNLFS